LPAASIGFDQRDAERRMFGLLYQAPPRIVRRSQSPLSRALPPSLMLSRLGSQQSWVSSQTFPAMSSRP
jgi:hypothetical protein